jgi:hypothetical protein
MKTAAFLAGLVAAVASSVQAISITHIEVLDEDDPNFSNVTVVVTVAGAGAGAMVSMSVKTTNGLTCQNFQPTSLQGTQWICTNWNPYFTGEFIVAVQAFDQVSYPASASTNATVVRTRHGTVNSVKFGSSTTYNPNDTWTDINTALVSLHNIGWMADPHGAASVGCNLVNVNPTITQGMTEEQMDIAFADTSAYKPVGTPFRIDVSLHARPTSIMGFGEIKRFAWTPDDTNAPAGAGRLVLDITSCSPWRNTYTTNLNAHVGFAPLFVTDTNMAAEMEGVLMCTSAHYMDVGPTNNDSASRIGLRVNGHSNTTSFLKTFIADSKLAQFGVTNVEDATNGLMGYVTHFDNYGDSEEDTAATPPTFTRIPGGTNIMYDYNGDGVGDSGYETRFAFVFHSPVAAEMGPAGETPDLGLSWIAGDFDGDGKADPAIYFADRASWNILLSANNYAATPVANFGGTGWTGSAGDFDGDGKADPAIYNAATATLKVMVSGNGYAQATVTGLGGDGYGTLCGDFDGDRKADPAVNQAVSGTFVVKCSGQNYVSASVSGFGGAAYQPVDGDFDGDRYADLCIYSATHQKWYFAISSRGYLIYGDEMAFGYPGYVPVSGDYDGDRKADLNLYNASLQRFYFSLSADSYLIYWLSEMGNANSVAVNGDFDGDGKADPAVVDTVTGILTVAVSSMNYSKATLSLIPQ